MQFSFNQLLLLASVARLVVAKSADSTSSLSKGRRRALDINGIQYTEFEHQATSSRLSYVTNSGICETTPGVNQYSGYLSAGHTTDMFFWLFEARSKPKAAPLALWLNGGPGCSSLIGLLTQNGPCRFVGNQSEPSLNPYSWNNYANMLYVDQPAGTGFSYGSDNVTSTVSAAKYVWKLLQSFYAAFPEYESRELGLFTESYGGHYGPAFASHFQEQNAKIEAGIVKGEKIKIVALGINNAWMDPAMVFKSYVDYAYNNTYRKLINESQYRNLMDVFNTQCVPALETCKGVSGDDKACYKAMDPCQDNITFPIEVANDFNAYDVREPRFSPHPTPSGNWEAWLTGKDIMKAIGANATFNSCGGAPAENILRTGDKARSFLPTFSKVVQSGITVLLWAGDADWVCNWMGNYDLASNVQYPNSAEFASANLKSYTVNGISYGEYKTAGNFSWLKVFASGHMVSLYQPEVALQAFVQTMQKKPLSAT